MKPKIENSLLALLLLLTFLSLKAEFPKIWTIIILVVTAIYFFPVKLILEKGYRGYKIFSDVLVSLSLGVIPVGFYKTDMDTVFAVFGLLNFAYAVYLLFFKQHTDQYRVTLLKHFLVIMLMTFIMLAP